MVLATQNPIEQDGTYHLPEAQLDRFLLKTIITYPNREEEIKIILNNSTQNLLNIDKLLTKKDILELQNLVDTIYVSENILNYIRDIVFYTRESKTLKELLMF
jgi:MoxR-like ATPase